MKKIFFSAIAISILISQTACFGSFELTKKVWEFNDNISESKFVKTLVFYVANIIPVYSIAGFVDVVVLNLIEFWSGSNPLAMEEGQVEEQLLTYKGDNYKLIATKNKISVQKLIDNSFADLGELKFDDSNESWSFNKDNKSVTLIDFKNTEVDFYTAGGIETVNQSSIDCIANVKDDSNTYALASK